MDELMARQTKHTFKVETRSNYNGNFIASTTQTFTVGNKACFKGASGLKFTAVTNPTLVYLEGDASMALPWSDPVTEPAYCAKHYVWP